MVFIVQCKNDFLYDIQFIANYNDMALILVICENIKLVNMYVI